MRHINIPIFIPHLGCPNTCVFCNQRTISGVGAFDLDSVRTEIENALNTVDECECEIAFFGGSFTGIDRSLMISLLEIASEYVVSGRVKSIRCSTRPDYISDEILSILKKYHVSVIELGLQSVSDKVLSTTRRGHNACDEEQATSLIKQYGFQLGGQMMIGLPSSSVDDEIKTAEFIVKAGCDIARIYPTIVFRDTELCNMSLLGSYTPLETHEAVERSYRAFRVLIEGGVRVIRIGLCDSENLHADSTYFAGPNHPAMGEMVINRYYLEKIKEGIAKFPESNTKRVNIYIPRGHMSKAVGQNKRNKCILAEQFSGLEIKFSELDSLSEYEILLEKDGKKICI
jgi:histone acetyltransferase (RNA polymerase elongator complex component)